MSIINVNKDNFEKEVLKSDKPVLVDFWSEGCGPCKQMDLILEEAAKDRPNVKFVKINARENQELAKEYHVRGVPNLLFFKEGKVVGSNIGFQNKVKLNQFIFKSLSADKEINLEELNKQNTLSPEEKAKVKSVTIKGMATFSLGVNGLYILGGGLLAASTAGVAPLVLGGLAMATGIQRIHETFKGVNRVKSQKESKSIKEQITENMNMSKKERTAIAIKSGLGLAQNAVVFSAGVALMAATGSIAVAIPAFLMSASSFMGGIPRAFSTVVNFMNIDNTISKKLNKTIPKDDKTSLNSNDNKPSPKMTKEIGQDFNKQVKPDNKDKEPSISSEQDNSAEAKPKKKNDNSNKM